jgi:hypothetical protein
MMPTTLPPTKTGGFDRGSEREGCAIRVYVLVTAYTPTALRLQPKRAAWYVHFTSLHGMCETKESCALACTARGGQKWSAPPHTPCGRRGGGKPPRLQGVATDRRKK